MRPSPLCQHNGSDFANPLFTDLIENIQVAARADPIRSLSSRNMLTPLKCTFAILAKTSPWLRNLNQMASGSPRAVHYPLAKSSFIDHLGFVMVKNFSLLMVFLASCSNSQTEREAAVPHEVRTMLVGEMAGADLVTGVGTIHYRRETPLAFTSDGKIAKILVEEGDSFRKGQILAALDLTTTNATLAVTRASLAQTRSDFERAKTLFAQGWITKAHLEKAQYEFAVAGENVNAQRFQTANAQILASRNGVVLDRKADPSQTVSAGQTVLLIGEIDSGLVLRVALADRDVSRMKLGSTAEVTFATLGGRKLSAKLIEIGGQSDPATGKFDCLFLLPMDPALRAGQFGRVSFLLTSDVTAGFTIPASSLSDVRADEGFVFVVNGAHQAALRKVSIQEIRPDGVLVRAGLASGERLIISGVDWVQSGENVKVSAADR